MKIVDHRDERPRCVAISTLSVRDYAEGPGGVIWQLSYDRGRARQVFEADTGKTYEVERDTLVVPLQVSLHIDGEGRA